MRGQGLSEVFIRDPPDPRELTAPSADSGMRAGGFRRDGSQSRGVGSGWRMRRPLEDHLATLPQLRAALPTSARTRFLRFRAEAGAAGSRPPGPRWHGDRGTRRTPNTLRSCPRRLPFAGVGAAFRVGATWPWPGGGLGPPLAGRVTQAAAAPASHEGGRRPLGGGGGGGGGCGWRPGRGRAAGGAGAGGAPLESP